MDREAGEGGGMEKTVILPGGRVTLSKARRDRWKWVPGTTLVVEETAEGVLLRPLLPLTKTEEVVGNPSKRG
jgi:hypothetical protein